MTADLTKARGSAKEVTEADFVEAQQHLALTWPVETLAALDICVRGIIRDEFAHLDAREKMQAALREARDALRENPRAQYQGPYIAQALRTIDAALAHSPEKPNE